VGQFCSAGGLVLLGSGKLGPQISCCPCRRLAPRSTPGLASHSCDCRHKKSVRDKASRYPPIYVNL